MDYTVRLQTAILDELKGGGTFNLDLKISYIDDRILRQARDAHTRATDRPGKPTQAKPEVPPPGKGAPRDTQKGNLAQTAGRGSQKKVKDPLPPNSQVKIDAPPRRTLICFGHNPADRLICPGLSDGSCTKDHLDTFQADAFSRWTSARNKYKGSKGLGSSST